MFDGDNSMRGKYQIILRTVTGVEAETNTRSPTHTQLNTC